MTRTPETSHEQSVRQEATLTLGPVLEMNAKTERFTNNIVANKLVTRQYRTPYVVPEKV
ncbi:MAG: hypothetical protein U1F83_12095 [Verrucomicrobiota bacterium]